MGKKPTDIVSKVPELNSVIRSEYDDKIVNKEIVKTIFNKVGLPFNSSLWSILKDNRSILLKLSKKGEYKFVNTPIYWASVKEIYDKYRSYAKDLSRRYHLKREPLVKPIVEEPVKVESKKESDIDSEINRAIVLLVNHGYFVYNCRF